MAHNNGRLYKLNHATYVCQYHLVWCTKYRGKVLDDYSKQQFKQMFKQIAQWKKLQILQWHIGNEHVHLYIVIPPKYSVSYAVQILKGKSSSWIKKKARNKFPLGSIWARGYYISTLGINEHQVRNYIKNQEHHRFDFPKLPLGK